MKKGTLFALGVFAVLLALFLGTREQQVSVGMKHLEMPAVDKAKLTALEISGAKVATLRKESGGWVVSDPATPDKKFPADEQQVGSALDALAEIKGAVLVSESPQKHAELEVDDAKGLKVRAIGDQGTVVELIIGKAAKNGGFYLRRVGQGAVFALPSRLGGLVRRDASGWRKREFITAKPDEVTQLAVRLAGAEPYTLKAGAGPGSWTLDEGTKAPAGFRLDAQAVQRMVQQMAMLRAQEFADGPADDAQGLTGAHDVLEAKLKDGRSLALNLGREPDPAAAHAPNAPKTAGLVPVRVDGDPQVYLIATWASGALRKKLADLRDLALLSFDPGKVTRLVIEAGGKKAVASKESDSWKVLEPKQLPAGFEFDPAEVTAQLSALRGIRAARLVEPTVADAQAGLAKPSATVQFTLEGGGSQALRFGKELAGAGGAKELYVKGSADDALYAIALGERTRLEVGVELFKKRPPPPPSNLNGMQGLDQLPPEIRRQIEAQLRQQAQQP